MLLVTPTMVRGVSPYPMAGGDYLETFGNIATWANNFVSPAEATRWGSAMANTNGTIPDGLRVDPKRCQQDRFARLELFTTPYRITPRDLSSLSAPSSLPYCSC